jgi:hypothetical protein
MKLQDVRTIARNLRLKPDGSTKAELIRKIQRKEGNFDCFSSAIHGGCDQHHCLWREDCLGSAAS